MSPRKKGPPQKVGAPDRAKRASLWPALRKSTTANETDAECHDCGWSSDASNAQATGSTHAHRTGHHVTVNRSYTVTYNEPV